ncbi:hypothetical protein DYBT9623_05584 [Dyadobacter sp. CECT 9623]|uniref:Uncharacterized protein n=1 Tax=Dyadobacter linearis TaxID=2823330 RepID=A0ABN7RN17_9BACT|nr:hypothetical protein DYBT9623_05584 [Dyadobacter sp. CECT 9623]
MGRSADPVTSNASISTSFGYISKINLRNWSSVTVSLTMMLTAWDKVFIASFCDLNKVCW